MNKKRGSTAESRGLFFRDLLVREGLKWKQAKERIEAADRELSSAPAGTSNRGAKRQSDEEPVEVTDVKIKRWRKSGAPMTGATAMAIRHCFNLNGTPELDYYLGKRDFYPNSVDQQEKNPGPGSETNVEAEGDQLLLRYCEQLVSRFEWIDVLGKQSFGGGNQQLRLDSVYTALRAEMFSASERAAAHSLFIDSQRPNASWAGNTAFTNSRPFDPIKKMPIMRGVVSQEDALSTGQMPVGKRANLADMVKEHPFLVILGEPASGKTTMLKWLAIRFAENWLASRDRSNDETDRAPVTVNIQHVDPFSDKNEIVEIGPTRIPIFLSLQEIAMELAKRPTTDLFGAIASRMTEAHIGTTGTGSQGNGSKSLDASLEDRLQCLATEGKLIVLLDGLDEVPDQKARKLAIDAIARFQRDYLHNSRAGSNGSPGNRDGCSQLVVTSRIVGYHTLPLPDDWPHAVVERMAKSTVKRYWQRLHKTVDLSNSETSRSSGDPVEVLFEKVFDSGRKGVDELAGIPLLATLLALIFKSDGSLPDRRVEIYDRALSYFVEEWGDETRPRSEEANVSSWKQLLCAVAREMHDSPTQSLLHRDEVVEILVTQQNEISDRDEGLRLKVDPEERAKALLNDNRNTVGILIERADGYFSFLHRTFQEYLASIWLLDDTDLAVDRIASRMDDPRWREPVLLAFGHAKLHGNSQRDYRDKLISQMIASTEPGLAVRRARFIALATADMASLPSIGVYVSLLEIVLTGAEGRRLRDLPEAQRVDIEDAVFAMADRDPEIFETALVQLLNDGTNAIRASVAHLIADNRWRTQGLLEALRVAEHLEDDRFDYAAARALSQVRTALAFPEIAKKLDELEDPLTPADIDEIDFEEVRSLSPEEYTRMMERVSRLRSEYPRRLRRWRVQKHLVKYDIDYQKNSKIWNAIEDTSTEIGNRAAVIGLHGGLGDYGNRRFQEDYRALSAFLQEGDVRREFYVDEGHEILLRFGFSNPVYKAAVFLDTLGGSRIKSGRVRPSFDLRQSILFDKSPLVGDIAKSRWATDEGSPTVDTKAQSHLALSSILRSTDGHRDLFAFIQSLDEPTRGNLRNAVTRSASLVSDAALRAFQELVSQEPDNPASLSPMQQYAFICALEAVAQINPTTPISFSKWANLCERASCEEAIFSLAGLHDDDIVYSAAVALDRLREHSLLELATHLRSLGLTIQGPWLGEGFSVEQCSVWPHSERPNDVSPALIDEALRWNIGEKRSDLSYALVMILVDKVANAADREAALSVLPWIGFFPADDLAEREKANSEHILEQALGVSDPYWRARSLLAIGETGLAWLHADQIRACADQIADPIERFIILERLAALHSDFGSSDLWADVISAGRAIKEPEQRWRALGALIKSGAGSRDDLMAELAQALDSIPQVWDRVQGWADVRRLIGMRNLAAQSSLRGLVKDEEEPLEREASLANSALNGYSAPLVLLLTEFGGIDLDAALALYVARASIDIREALDIVDAVESANRLQVQQSSLSIPHEANPKMETELEEIAGSESLNLTMVTAQRILDLYEIDQEKASRLCDRFSLRAVSSLSAAQTWLSKPSSLLARRAAMEIARRTRQRDFKIIDPLLRAMASENDEAKVMAADILMRGSNFVKRMPRIFSAHDVGLEALMTAGEFLADPEQSHVSLAPKIFLFDVIHDDPIVFEQLLRFATSDDENGRIARLVLSETGEASPEIDELIRDSFASAPHDMKVALLTGLSARSQSDPNFPLKAFILWLREAAVHITQPIRFLHEYVGDVVSAVRHALESNDSSEDMLAAAQSALAERTADLRETFLTGDDDAIAEAIKAFVERFYARGPDWRPVRDGSAELEHLLDHYGPVAVQTLAAWLRQYLLKEERDSQVLSALAFATSQCCQRFPDQVMLALFGSEEFLNLPDASSERNLLDRMFMVIRERPTADVGSSLLALSARYRPIEEVEVQCLLHAALSVDPVSEQRLEHLLRNIRAVSDSALSVLESALSSRSARKQRAAIRLLGSLLRTPGNSGESLRVATGLLTRFAYTGDGETLPIGIASRSEKGEGAFYFMHHALSESALRELRRVWS